MNGIVKAAAALAVAFLTGCQAGAPAAGLAAAGPSMAIEAVPASAVVSLHLETPYALQSVVGAYTAAEVDHVKLAVYRGGTAVSGATATVAKAALGNAVTLKNLRAGTSYEVRASAYADAAEATLISDAATSKASFTTPAVTTTNGVASINDAAIAITLPVKLAKREVAATLDFKVTPHLLMYFAATHVRITVKAGTNVISTRTETITAATATHTLTNLHLGTTYTILTEGIKPASGTSAERKFSDDASSVLTFTTPSAGGTTVEDDMNVVLGTTVARVPCDF